jgi:dUTPase
MDTITTNTIAEDLGRPLKLSNVKIRSVEKSTGYDFYAAEDITISFPEEGKQVIVAHTDCVMPTPPKGSGFILVPRASLDPSDQETSVARSWCAVLEEDMLRSCETVYLVFNNKSTIHSLTHHIKEGDKVGEYILCNPTELITQSDKLTQ